MIELTTGVVFLMSSLYGSGNADNHVENIASDTDSRAAITIELSTSTNSKIGGSKEANSAEAYVRKTFADTPILVDIARCESNFHQFDDNGKLIRGRVNREDVGVFQINEKFHDETAKKLGLDLHTLEGNAAYAKHLYEEQGSQPWVYSSKCWAAADLAVNK